jgi:hypothetical protein
VVREAGQGRLLAREAERDLIDVDWLAHIRDQVSVIGETVEELQRSGAGGGERQRAVPQAPPARRDSRSGACRADRLLAVLPSGSLLARLDGLSVALVSVELWRSSVVVRTAALPTALSERLEMEHREAMRSWENRAGSAHDKGAVPPPPEHPAVQRLLALSLKLSDDLATPYRVSRRSAGGTGTEWRAEWRFVPSLPTGASRLIVSVDAPSDVRFDQVFTGPVGQPRRS